MEFWTQHGAAILKSLATNSVYVITVGLFIVAIFRCITPVAKCRMQLKRAIRKIKRDDKSDVWQDKNFLGKGQLYQQWNEYLHSRLFADDEYHNASPLDDYINDETVIYEPGFTAFADAVPGLLVSLGFLGTLIGLVLGLRDFRIDDTASTMEAIKVLVNGMRYAFTTSIVGVIGSISFSLMLRWVQGSARKTLSRFYDVMQHHAHMVTVDPITQITIYQQEQTTLLHSLAQDLTGSFTDRVGAAIDMAVQPMQQSLDRFVTATTQKQLEGLDIIVNRFVRSMNDSLQGQFNNLAKTIDETCRWHKDTQETVQATIEGLNRVSRDIVQIQQMSESLITKFDKYMNRLGAAQHQIDEGFSVVSSGVKDMEMVARQQASYVSQIGQMQADFMREVTSFQTRMDQFTRTFTESANTSASAMMKVSAELKHNGETLTASHKAFTDGVNEELNHAFGMFDANMQDIIDDLTNVINSIKASVDTMPQTLNQTARQFSEQMRQLTGYLQDSQERMDDALRRANGASRRNGGM